MSRTEQLLVSERVDGATPSGSSVLEATEIDPWSLRAVSGGMSGGLTAFVAFAATERFLPRVLLIGVLTTLLTMILGVGYDALVD